MKKFLILSIIGLAVITAFVISHHELQAHPPQAPEPAPQDAADQNPDPDPVIGQEPAITTATATAAADNSDAHGRDKIIEYTVKSGDVIGSIAGQFGLSVNTILWANNLSANSLIRPGDKLVIPPVDGIVYTVKSGDTVSRIVSVYGVDADKIAEANALPADLALKIGQVLVIPGGKPLPTVSTAARSAAATKKQPTAATNNSSGITWTSGALQELNRVPAFVRTTVKNKVNAYALSHDIHVITKEIYDSIEV